jgi:hypothetical protein
VKDGFEFSRGCDTALPLARALIARGLLREEHLQAADKSPVSALEAVLAEIVNNNFCGAQELEEARRNLAGWLEVHDAQYLTNTS